MSQSARRAPAGRALWAEWFARPPYPGLWLAAAVVLMFSLSLVLPRRLRAAPETVVYAPAPAPVPGSAEPRVPAPAAAPPVREATPSVTVRSLPARPAAPESEPSVPTPPAVSPGPPAPLEPSAGVAAGIPSSRPEGSLPAGRPSPEPERPVAPPAPPRESEPGLAGPVVAPGAGALAIYFDADSTTFAANRERMPLRVEVYVDGEKRLDSTDPEKREFVIGPVPAGERDVRIVPYVGDAPAEPREKRVRVQPGQETPYRAVLRLEDGMSRVGKFRPRD